MKDRRRTIFILILVFGMLFFAAPRKIHSINKFLTRAVCVLEEKIFRRLSFEMVSPQPALGGIHNKFLLRDTYDRKWLFKEQTSVRAGICVGAYRFGRYCGWDIPQTHRFSVIVNGKKLSGTAQRFIEGVRTFQWADFSGIPQDELDSLVAHQAFDYLLFNLENSPPNFLIREQDGHVFYIDKDRAFGNEAKDIALSDGYTYGALPPLEASLYNRIWDAFKKGEVTIDVSRSMAFLNYLSRTDWEYVLDHFDFLIGRRENVLSQGSAPLRQRKETLRSDFKQFYRSVSKKSGIPLLDNVRFLPYGNHVLYRLMSGLVGAMRYGTVLLRPSQAQVCSFDLIAAPGAWNMLRRDFLPLPQSRYDLEEAIDTLRSLLARTDNENERVAIKMYLERCALLKKQGQRKNLLDFLILWRVNQDSANINMEAFTGVYELTRHTPHHVKALTSYFIGKQMYLCYRDSSLREALNMIEPDQRQYCLEGILDAAGEYFPPEKMDFYTRLFQEVASDHKPLIALYVGEQVESFAQLEEIKEKREFSSYARQLHYGFGVRMGKRIVAHPEEALSLMAREDKTYQAQLYPGFAMGLARVCAKDYRLFRRCLKEIPVPLRFFCLEALGQRFLFENDFDQRQVKDFLSSEMLAPVEKRIFCRGMGRAMAYWFFFEPQEISPWILDLTSTERYDTFLGSRVYLTRQLTGTYIETHSQRWKRMGLLREAMFQDL